MTSRAEIASPSRASWWLGLVLLPLLAGLAVSRSALGTRLDSFTIDEPWHVVAGAAYVRGGDRHLNPEHPPLVKVWVGMFLPDSFTLGPEPLLREKEQERQWVERTMFLENDAQQIQRDVRRAMWALNGSLVLLLGLLLWRAVGLAWAVGTLGFIALEPTLGAHLPVVMTDGPLALTLACALVAAGILAAQWRWWWALALGAAVGVALTAKHSALPGLLGIGAVLIVAAFYGFKQRGVREVLRRAAQLGLVAAVALLILWASYGFRFSADANGQDAFNRPLPDKIEEVSTPALRNALQLADQYRLLPRAYLWGLADTVRTGVGGRNIALHLVWGKHYEGRTPWFTWPAIIAAKVPLALSALSVFGLVLLWRAPLPASARWMLVALVLASGLHLAALMVSPAAWGGIRHGTPLIIALGIVAGGAVAEAWRRGSRRLQVSVAALLLVALAMTIREPRLWEYHNELVGGSNNAWRYFKNEGLDLGQRFTEIRGFHDREIIKSGLPLYADYWLMESEARAAKLRYRRMVEDLNDSNVQGVYDGWFVTEDTARVGVPQFDWDPKVVFKEMRLVADLGNASIWRGRLIRPKARASSMQGKVMDYIYKDNGKDWALVARRLEEVALVSPGSVGAATELGNAYLRLGDREAAARAYARPLQQDKMPIDEDLAQQLREQIAKVESTQDLNKIVLLRNPWME